MLQVRDSAPDADLACQTDDRHVEDDLPAFTYDSLSLGLAILRAFVNRDRDQGLKPAGILLNESAEPIRALETVSDAASSSALHMIGRARDVDVARR